MAGRKPIGSFPSSSSFTADLFGSKDPHNSSSSSSAGIFSSMFPPPPTAPGRNPSSSRNGTWQSEPSKSQDWKPRSGNSIIKKDGEDMSNGESIFQQEKIEPCHLSSSIYYGGQDIFSRHPNSQSSDSYPTFKKDGEEEDLNGSNSQAHRGNWWQVIVDDPSGLLSQSNKSVYVVDYQLYKGVDVKNSRELYSTTYMLQLPFCSECSVSSLEMFV